MKEKLDKIRQKNSIRLTWPKSYSAGRIALTFEMHTWRMK
jgi:hypothetical protein